MLYLRQSQWEILKEEERRYRYLAEKHCGLTQSLLFLINKVHTHTHTYVCKCTVVLWELDHKTGQCWNQEGWKSNSFPVCGSGDAGSPAAVLVFGIQSGKHYTFLKKVEIDL